MSDGAATPNSHREEDVDPGVPIDTLASFEYEASTNFLGRIRRAIQRRTAASQVVSFSWDIPFLILIEFWLTLANQLFPQSPRKDHEQ